MTHAVLSVLHGQFADAARQNVLVFLLLPAAIMAFYLKPKVVSGAAIGIVVAFGVTRNLWPAWVGIG